MLCRFALSVRSLRPRKFATSAALFLTALGTVTLGRLDAQVTYAGVQSTVPVQQTIAPGGMSLDQAGNLDFYDAGSSSILQVPVTGGTPTALQSQVAGPAVSWDSESSNGTLVYLSSNASNPNWVASADEVGGNLTAPNFLVGPETATSALASVPLSTGPDTLVVFSDSTGQLYFMTRTGGSWTAPNNISGAIVAGPLSLALLPLPSGGAFLEYEGPDFKFYWSQYASGSWTAVAPFASPNIASPAGSGPIGMALDSAGDLFVSDTNNSAVWEYPWIGRSSLGTPIGSVSTLPYPERLEIGASLNGPTGLAADNLGNLYVADTGNARIVKIVLQGANFGDQALNSTSASIPLTFTFSTTVKLGATTVLTNGLTSQDFADDGTGSCSSGSTFTAGQTCNVNITFSPLLVGNRDGAVVLQYYTGLVLAMAYVHGTGRGSQLSFLPGKQTSIPTNQEAVNLAVDASGDIFYSANHGTTTGELVLNAGSYTNQNSPIININGLQLIGLAFDGAGSAYLASASGAPGDGLLSGIEKFVPEPIFISEPWAPEVAGVGPINVNEINGAPTTSPDNMGVDGSGNVYIIDSVTSNVLKATLDGRLYSVSVLYQPSNGDLKPQYLAVDSADDLYVAGTLPTDTGAVQKWTPSSSGYTQSTVTNQLGTLAVDGNGIVYVGQVGQVLREVPTSNGYVESTLPIPGLVGSAVVSVAVDRQGNLYVGDGSDRVLRVDFNDPGNTAFPSSTEVGALDVNDGKQIVQVFNNGTQQLKFTKIQYPADFPEADGDSNACSTSKAVDAGQSCDLPIEFYPQSAGSLSENVTLVDNVGSQSIPVSGTGISAASHFSITTSSTVVAGTPFNLTVTALDAAGNTITGFNGTVSFTSSDTKFVNPGPLTLSSGTAQTNVTLKTAGAQTITATDTSVGSLSSSGNFSVTPGAATTLQFGGAAASQAAGQAFAFTMSAYDSYSNLATGYTGMVHFTSSDASAKLPMDSGLTNGTGSFAATLVTTGPQSITATDTVNNALNGSAPYTVTAQQVAVPKVVGDTQAAASTAINSAGLVVGSVTGATSATVPAGNVISQSPIAATNVNLGSAVNLVVSTGAIPSTLTAPSEGSVLVGPIVTFKWKAPSGATGYGLRLGTTVGGNNIWSSGQITATSATAKGLPTNGETIFGRLYTNYGSFEVYTDYVFTAATSAALTSPTGGTVLAGPAVIFNWSTAGGATGYALRLGTTAGGNNIWSSGPITATSATPKGLPTNGETVYARLYTTYGSTQAYTDYTFTAATSAALTSPTGGSVLTGPSVTFSWTTASGATGYALRAGTTLGGNNIWSSGTITTTSITARSLPTNGETVYVRLYTTYGSTQAYTDYTFTAATSAALTSPTGGSVLTGPSETFNWTTAAGATGYALRLGTSLGGNNIWSSGSITATSATAKNLPTNGETVYARLYTTFGSTQAYTDYTFTSYTAP